MRTGVADVSAGTRLRAGFTGKVYTVQAVDEDDGLVHVAGLPPISVTEIRRNIADGKIEVID